MTARRLRRGPPDWVVALLAVAMLATGLWLVAMLVWEALAWPRWFLGDWFGQ